MSGLKKTISKAIAPFSPDVRQCLILGNFDYSPIRYGTKVDKAGKMILDANGNPKQFGFADLHHVEPDLQLFREKIVNYGFDDLDVVTRTNLSMK